MPPKRRRKSKAVCSDDLDSEYNGSDDETADILRSLKTSDTNRWALKSSRLKQQTSDTKRRRVTADAEFTQQELDDLAIGLEKSRRPNTISAYGNHVKKFHWFLGRDEHGEHRPQPYSGDMLAPGGLAVATRFIQWVAQNMPGMEYPRKAPSLSYAVLDACRSMLANLYRQQQLQQGTHQESVAKLGDNAAFAAAWTAAVKSLEQKGVRPPAHKDPQSNTVEDTYSEEDYMRLVRHLLSGKSPEHARDLSIVTMSQNCVNRSDDSRLTYLADLLRPRLLTCLGPSPAYLLAAVGKGGKAQRNNKPAYSGSIRARRPEECPHGALGRYLAQRFTIECEPFPSLASSSNDFYTTPLWRGQVPTRSISYDELASSLKSALRDLEIIIKKVTHAMRVAGARRMDQAGVDDQVIARMGSWLYEAMYRSYLLFFKPEGLMAAGGWPGAARKEFDRFWAERFCVEVPNELILLLFPFLPGLQREVQVLAAAAGNSKKSIVKVLEYLGLVAVQDALELAPQFPEQPVHALLLKNNTFMALLKDYQHKKSSGVYERLRPRSSQEMLVQVQGILCQLVNGLCSGGSLSSSLAADISAAAKAAATGAATDEEVRIEQERQTQRQQVQQMLQQLERGEQPEVDMGEEEQQLRPVDGQQVSAQQGAPQHQAQVHAARPASPGRPQLEHLLHSGVQQATPAALAPARAAGGGEAAAAHGSPSQAGAHAADGALTAGGALVLSPTGPSAAYAKYADATATATRAQLAPLLPTVQPAAQPAAQPTAVPFSMLQGQPQLGSADNTSGMLPPTLYDISVRNDVVWHPVAGLVRIVATPPTGMHAGCQQLGQLGQLGQGLQPMYQQPWVLGASQPVAGAAHCRPVASDAAVCGQQPPAAAATAVGGAVAVVTSGAAAPGVHPFPTLGKFRSVAEFYTCFSKPDARTGQPALEEQEDAAGSSWRRGGKQAADTGGRGSNRQRWYELKNTANAIRWLAAERNKQRGPQVSPSKVAADLDKKREAEGMTVPNFCKRLISEYTKSVPAEQRQKPAAAKGKGKTAAAKGKSAAAKGKKQREAAGRA